MKGASRNNVGGMFQKKKNTNSQKWSRFSVTGYTTFSVYKTVYMKRLCNEMYSQVLGEEKIVLMRCHIRPIYRFAI